MDRWRTMGIHRTDYAELDAVAWRYSQRQCDQRLPCDLRQWSLTFDRHNHTLLYWSGFRQASPTMA